MSLFLCPRWRNKSDLFIYLFYKCSVIYIGHNYMQATITIQINSCRQHINSEIKQSSLPKTSSGKNKQKKTCKIVNIVLGFIACNYKYKNKELNEVPRYKSRPSTSLICSAILVPIVQRDIDKIEKEQRRATNIVPVIRNHSYIQRIKNLYLSSLNCTNACSRTIN